METERGGEPEPRYLGFAILPHIALFALLVSLLELAGIAGWLNEFILPRPSKIGAAFVEVYVTQRTVYWHAAVTLYETVVGFTIAAVVGVGLAVASAVSDPFRRYVSPYAIVLNVTPGLALTPIVIAWFGFGWSSKIALAAIVSFFPIFVNTLAGLTQGDDDRREMFRSLGASRMQTFLKLQLPTALPTTIAGLQIGVTAALVGAIVAEFASASEGIGVLMKRFSFALNIQATIATLLTMSLLGLLLFVILEIIDDRLVFWRRDVRMARVSRRRAARWRVPSPQQTKETVEGGTKK
ncbi:ABC transporter permease [Mesorhizobium sp. 10J20-29]